MDPQHLHISDTGMTALEARTQLAELEGERALALLDGLGDVDPYMDDLHQEIQASRDAYVGAAVTEMAMLRAELFGPQLG